jgi:signal transduction histidine kinase
MFRFILLLFCFSSYCQFKISYFNTENGLPHDLCYQVIQDKKGYIWLGTDNGLVKFNGQEFEVFNRNQGLNSSFVIDIVEKDGKKYVATWGGGCYIFENNTFKLLKGEKYKFSKQQQILCDNKGYIYTVENKKRLNILSKKNKIYFGLFGLYKTSNYLQWCGLSNSINYKKNNLISKREIPLDIQIANIYNEIYSFTDRYSPQFKGVCSVNKKSKRSFSFLNEYFIIDIIKRDKFYTAVTPTSIIEFNSHKILKINQLEYKNKSIVHYLENKKFKVFVLLDKKTSVNELLVINKQNNNKTFYKNNVIKSSVSDVLISRDNTIWLSTYGNGLITFQENILPVKKSVLKNNFVFDYIAQSNRHFFLTNDNIIGTDKDFNFLGKIEFKTCAYFKGKRKDTIILINKDQINRSVTFLNTYFKSEFQNVKYKWDKIEIEYGDNHLHYFMDKKWKKVNFNLTDEEKVFFKIRQLINYKDKLYIVSNYGLYVLNEKFQIKKIYNKYNSLKDNEVKKVFVLHDKLYILQYQNIAVFDGKHLVNYPYVNSQNNFLNDFTFAQNGTVCIASQKGLLFFENGIYYLYTKNEGLSSSFYSKIYKNEKNELIALGNNGVDVFKTFDLHNSHKLKIILTLHDKVLEPLKTIYLEPSKSNVVKIDVINFIKSKFQLEYKINNQKWQTLKGNSVDFSNYSNGSYELKIRWRFYFSNWKTLPLYNVEKIAPWYFRWYFYFPVVVLFGFVVTYVIKRRIESLKSRNYRLQTLLDNNSKLQFQLEEMRNDIAQDFHDELGNKLAGISVLSDKLLNDEKLKSYKNYPIIERIYTDSQDLFNGIRDFIWAIDSKNGNLEELIFALTDFGENLFEYSSIKFIVDNKVEYNTFLLPNFWNRQLLLLFKEAMTNAYKHSQATQLDLIFSIEDGFLIIICQDNGVGFDKEKLLRQNGLLNFQKRVTKLKSVLIINSNFGTEIIFKGKLL